MPAKVVTLPKTSKTVVAICVATQVLAAWSIAHRQQGNAWLALVAFLAGGFIADLISGLFHFSFDYVWPPETPIMGPVAVEFHEHHLEPTLDPSAVATNLTKGAYGALPLAAITTMVALRSGESAGAFFGLAALLATSVWMLGFHQIHSYSHMGSRLGPEEFNGAVAAISRLPESEQRREFARLFDRVGIPRWARLLQRLGLILRPEIHWRHHIRFETDFSSVNGWSDVVMNPAYRFLVRRIRAKAGEDANGAVRQAAKTML